MEIIIGSLPPLTPQSQKITQRNSQTVEAQLLHVRPPRKGVAGPSGRERRNKEVNDPRTARVLTIMVPDATQLPVDLDGEKYDLSLRIIRRQ
jgi:hypothetical protein